MPASAWIDPVRVASAAALFAAAIAMSGGPASAEEPIDPSLLAGDPAYGEYLASECVTCHQLDGSYDGIPPISGWPRPDFIRALLAYKAGLRDNPVMASVAGSLADDEMAALAAYFEGAE
ncbi:MAG: c-type cytochrome [Pseudomonadota bacterium]